MNKIMIDEIFKAYKYAESLTKSYDKLVMQEALNSFYYSVNSLLTSEKSYERIACLMERKNKLINFKLKVDDILKNMDKLLRTILIKKHIKLIQAEEIAKNLNLSVRTYFRRLEQAEEIMLQNITM